MLTLRLSPFFNNKMAVDPNSQLFCPLIRLPIARLLFLRLFLPVLGEPETSAGEGMSPLNKRRSEQHLSV